MKSKVVIVLGHESSGCRLVTDTLIKAGKYVEPEYTRLNGWWDDFGVIEYIDNAKIITRRSIPSYNKDLRRFEDVHGLLERLTEVGYDVRIVLTVRDKTVAMESKMINHTPGRVDLCKSEMDVAKETTNSIIKSQYSSFVFSYETFMYLKFGYLDSLYKYCGIESKYMPDLVDGNKKYFK